MRRWRCPGRSIAPTLEETAMNNYGLATADRLTHIKIVAVALVACIAVIGAGKAAYQGASEPNARVEARVQKISAEKLVVWTSADRVIR
jgi:hypothetical protein